MVCTGLSIDGAAGEAKGASLRVAFDHRLKLEFHGSKVTSDAGLLAFRELDDALSLTDLAGEALTDTRTGQNCRHTVLLNTQRSPQTELTYERSGGLGAGEPVAVLRRTREVSYLVLCGGRIGRPSGKCRFMMGRCYEPSHPQSGYHDCSHNLLYGCSDDSTGSAIRSVHTRAAFTHGGLRRVESLFPRADPASQAGRWGHENSVG